MIKKILIELNRDEKKISIKIKVPVEIESFFSELSEDKKTSAKWFKNPELTEAAEFYIAEEKYAEIQNKLSDIGLHTYNDFGDGLIRARAINLAPLRTIGVGSENGITLYSENFENNGIDFEMYVRELGLAIKAIWRDFISKKTLKAVISYEI